MEINLDHIAVVNTSAENAINFFEKFLKMKLEYSFNLSEDFAESLFNTRPDEPIKILKFINNKGLTIESFIIKNRTFNKCFFRHICLQVDNVKNFIKNADFDENLFEIK
jgi:catechol 2,3-dioxygenase-like lactoylglutathione lyase family enzyme